MTPENPIRTQLQQAYAAAYLQICITLGVVAVYRAPKAGPTDASNIYVMPDTAVVATKLYTNMETEGTTRKFIIPQQTNLAVPENRAEITIGVNVYSIDSFEPDALDSHWVTYATVRTPKALGPSE